jgi:hypothetical protein
MADVEAELQRLEREVMATVKARTELEERLANPDALRSATARAYRDRDAVTSPLLEEAREKVAGADIGGGSTSDPDARRHGGSGLLR